MPLTIYKRDGYYWFRGRIDQLPSRKYYRQSTQKTTEKDAISIRNYFEQREIEKFYGGEQNSITFAEAVLDYDANAETAKDLIAIVNEIGDMKLSQITPKFIKNLGYRMKPNNAVDSWKRHIITPIRAVINNAHQHGKCPPISIKAYSKNEQLKQDNKRNKASRVKKVPGSWPWIIAFRASAPSHLGLLAQFMFETGARIGQSTEITFNDLGKLHNIAPKKGEAKIPKGKVLLPESKGFDKQPVAISIELYEELMLLTPLYTRLKSGKVLSNRLFGYQGKDSVYGTWKRACERAGIEYIRPHGAGRHGFATEMMVRQGLDPMTVAEAGRWVDVRMLFETYAHAEGTDEKIQQAFRTGRVQATKQNANK